ncbi:MAG: 4Fe-4S binding protein [Candidatus Omnitrophota bacterium]
MKPLVDNYEKLKVFALSEGASLFGVADAVSIRDSFNIEPKAILQGLDFAISIGVRLSGKILETVVDEPSKLYAFHYKRINSLLDDIAIKIANFIQDKGACALPVPASYVEDWKRQTGALSHKKIGYMAGLGFIGRSGLLINPEFGSQARYASILTDFPLKVDVPRDGSCAGCRECVKACPAGAIKDTSGQLNLEACRELLKVFANKPGIGHSICGVCVKVCKGLAGQRVSE